MIKPCLLAVPCAKHQWNTDCCVVYIYLCVCFQEAKAIIAQRSGNPREFFKQKERAMTISVDTSPVSIHRTGKHFKTHLTIIFYAFHVKLRETKH